MPRRKIVFVIVEGPSDEDALSVILSRIYHKNELFVYIMRGDITTKRGVNAKNILSQVGNIIRDYAKSNNFKKIHFKQIIHIVDTDGAFISDEHVLVVKSAEKPLYSTEDIQTCNKDAIVQRNKQKQENLNILCTTKKIWDVPYQVFYMSCNLDHVLYDKLNSSDEDKKDDSYRFATCYKDNIQDFWNFISSSDFSVMIEYMKSWEYIKKGRHSLERHSNLGLCFKDEFTSA